jgi:hypothetical protein
VPHHQAETATAGAIQSFLARHLGLEPVDPSPV